MPCSPSTKPTAYPNGGHDFRREYLQLGQLAELFPDVPRIALTATADKRTREEIVERLHLQNAERFLSSFDRPNIFLPHRTQGAAAQAVAGVPRRAPQRCRHCLLPVAQEGR
nr:hypothetical protein GCM10020185_10700 [Pseudomonas brassicacearum subsp. brassicacearum]